MERRMTLRSKTKNDKRKYGLLASDIEKYTRVGSQELQKGNLTRACEAFEFAYRRSLQLGEGYTERACSLNVGAIYVALGRYEQGLEFLQKAVPPMNKTDSRSNGDLYYNFGIGYEGLGKFSEAVKYYEKAAEEYKSDGLVLANSDSKVLLDIYSHLATIYSKQGDHVKVARSYEFLSAECLRLKFPILRVQAMSQQANHLHSALDLDRATAVSDECFDLCVKLDESTTLAKVFNQLGLIYTQCKVYQKAASCFEVALPMTRGLHTNRSVEAVIMQNLGAVYNSMGDYQRSITLHEGAVDLHGQVGNRSGQGQCFMNLAFAFTQLQDPTSAGDSYLHALQAAKDTGDKVCQWQALEGLAGVACTRNDSEKAVTYYKQALSILAATPGDKTEVQERIVGKLTDALKNQVEQTSSNQSQMEVAPRDDASPLLRKRSTKPHFDYTHLGLGEYAAESDSSLTNRNNSKKHKQRKKSDVEMSESKQGLEPSWTRKASTNGDDSMKGRPRRKLYKRAGNISVHRQPLLRTDGHDSEEEWIKKMKMVHGTDSDTSLQQGYQEKLRPPSAPPPSMFDIVKQVEPLVQTRIHEESSESETDSDREEVRRQMKEMSAEAAVDTDDESDNDDNDVHDQKTSTPKFKKLSQKALDKNQVVGEQNLYDGTPAKVAKKVRSESDESASGTEDDEEEEMNVSVDSAEKTEKESESRGKSVVKNGHRRGNLPNKGAGLAASDSDDDDRPPLPTSSPPTTLRDTYEKPSFFNRSNRGTTSLGRHAEDENEDPPYASIQHVRNGTNHKESDDDIDDDPIYSDAPPTLPQRNYSQLSRAQKNPTRDIVQYRYNQSKANQTDLNLPSATKSKTCIIL